MATGLPADPIVLPFGDLRKLLAKAIYEMSSIVGLHLTNGDSPDSP